MTIQDFLGRLRSVKKSGTGWNAFCPSHEDKDRPSLSVALSGHRILVKCFTGCPTEAIVAAVQCSVSDLFTDTRERPNSPAVRQLVATYDYTDEHGTLKYQVCRFEPKDFRPRRPDGAWGLGDVARVPYRLHELVDVPCPIWVEGEKDADALARLGVPATTGAGGSSAWRDDYADTLVRLGTTELVILPDHDEPGERYASAVAAAFLRRGCRVKIVRLPDLPVKGDVSDWLGFGNTEADLRAVIEATPWTAQQEAPAPIGAVPFATVLDELFASLQSGGIRRVGTPFPSLNNFLGGGFAPGELVYLGARPGVGKTALGLEIARRAAADGVGVLVVSREMVNMALARRILAQTARVPAGAIRSGRLSDLEWATLRQESHKLRSLPLWLTDQAVSLDEITAMVGGFSGTPGLGLLVVDYLQLVRAPAEVRDRRLQVEAVSQGLKGVALSRQIPVLCLSSLSRAPQGMRDRRPTLSDLRESGELEHDADIVLLLHRAPMDTETECIVEKNRDGRQGTAHLCFRPEFVAFDEVAVRNED